MKYFVFRISYFVYCISYIAFRITYIVYRISYIVYRITYIVYGPKWSGTTGRYSGKLLSVGPLLVDIQKVNFHIYIYIYRVSSQLVYNFVFKGNVNLFAQSRKLEKELVATIPFLFFRDWIGMLVFFPVWKKPYI